MDPPHSGTVTRAPRFPLLARTHTPTTTCSASPAAQVEKRKSTTSAVQENSSEVSSAKGIMASVPATPPLSGT